jgi:hypothetical protein
MALLTNINGKFSVSDAGAVTFNNAFTFPTADGSANYVLKTNGSGQLSWAPDNNDGNVTGTGAANRVTYWSSATNVTSDAGFTYNGAGRVNTDESFGVSKDGADTVADGPFFRLTNAAATRQYIWQLDASNNIDYWYYNGSTWTQTISLLNNGGATFAGNVTTNTAFIALGSLPALQASSIFIDSPTATINRLGVTGANTTTKGTFVISQYSSDGSLGADTVTIDSSGNSTFSGSSGAISGTGSVYINNGDDAFALVINNAGTSSQNDRGVFDARVGGGSVLRINNSGNVGIGVSSLQSWAKLQVAGTAGAQTGANQALYVTAPSTTAGEGVGIRLSAASGSNEAVGIIGMVNNASGNAGSMTFHTYNLGSDIPERMRIDSLGQVGIGVTPSTSYVDSRAIEIGGNGYIWSEQTPSIYGSFMTGIGFYYNAAGATIYKTTNLQISRHVQYQGEHLFQYAAAGTAGGAITWSEAFRTSDTGNVGIGTDTPDYKLDVDSDVAGDWVTRIKNNSATGYGLYIESSSNSAQYMLGLHNGLDYQFIVNGAGHVGIGTASPAVKLIVKDSQDASFDSGIGIIRSNSSQTGYINMVGGAMNINAPNAVPIKFRDGGNMNVTIAGDGNVGIGDTAPPSLSANTSSLSVNSTRTDLSGALFQKSNGVLKFQQYWSTAGIIADVSAGDYFWKLANVNKMGLDTGTGALTVVGDVVAYGSPSDKRLKENIKPIKSALDKVSKLQGVTFDWKKSDSILKIKKDIGFIAQDVQKVVPELVRENENGMLSMRHQGIAPILLEAIKELKAEIDELKKQIK